MRATAYLLGYLRNGVVEDVIITSEFPVTTLLKTSSRLQVKLRESHGGSYDEAYNRMLQDIANDRTVSWSWLRKMPGITAQLTRSPRTGDVVGVDRWVKT